MKLNRREKEKAKMKKKYFYFENMNQVLESLEFVLTLLNLYISMIPFHKISQLIYEYRSLYFC